MVDAIKRDIQTQEERNNRRRLGQILLDYGFLSPAQLRLGLRRHQESGRFLGETLVETGLIGRKVWLETLSLQLGIPSIDLRAFNPEERIIRTIPEELARSYTAIAVGHSGNELATAMRFPQNEEVVRKIENTTSETVLPVIGWAGDIEKWLDEVYRTRPTKPSRAYEEPSTVEPSGLQQGLHLECNPLDIHASLYFNGLRGAIEAIPMEAVQEIIQILLKAYHEDKNIFIMGNGGSAATASHFSCDLGKSTAVDGKKRFRVISLTENVSLLTAWANDSHYENAFVEQLRNLIRVGDVVIGISTSGNSPNVLNAIEYANSKRAITIGLTGFSGGKLKDMVRLCLIVPSFSVQHTEDVHHTLHHLISMHLRAILRDKGEIY